MRLLGWLMPSAPLIVIATSLTDVVARSPSCAEGGLILEGTTKLDVAFERLMEATVLHYAAILPGETSCY